jgi:hypothetical protein
MEDIIIELVSSILPTILLLLGGQFILNKYDLSKKKRETEIELLKKIREEKYKVIGKVYSSFSDFMRLYREINSPFCDLKNIDTKNLLFNEIIKCESKIEGLVLEISCEFFDEHDDEEKIEYMLGNFRQSIQIWREKVINSEALPFNRSFQDDYVRFKKSFAAVASFMVAKVHGQMEKPETKIENVQALILGSFDNKYEKWNLDETLRPISKNYYQDTNDKRQNLST